eukprot:1146664-Pelagomonas_calceolata.AAC.2
MNGFETRKQRFFRPGRAGEWVLCSNAWEQGTDKRRIVIANQNAACIQERIPNWQASKTWEQQKMPQLPIHANATTLLYLTLPYHER